MVEPVPQKPSRQFSFTNHQLVNPTTPLPGSNVDTELDRANSAISDVIDFVRQAIDDDGTILASAASSLIGPQGPVGSTGPAGPEGAQGPEGPIGLTGAQGAQGVQGIQGTTGAAGQSFTPDAIAPAASKSTYDGEATGFAFLDATNGLIYFKLSGTSGDWSTGAMFGRGPQGLTGAQGIQGVQGIQGIQGPQGIQGVIGPDGPQGVRGLTWRGAYAGGTAYVVDDAVSYDGSAYINILASTGNLPTNGTYWALLSAKGDPGATGATGDTGAAGATGTTGAQGIQGPQGDAGPSGPAGPATDINALTAKTTPVDADVTHIQDSADSFNNKKLTFSNLIAYVLTKVASAANFRANTNGLLGVNNVWSSAAEVGLSDAATIAVDMSTFLNATVTLAGNRTLGQPSSTKVGQSGVIRIVQDATGSRTLAYHADWEFAGGTAPVLSTAANSQDLLFYQVLAANRIFASLVKGVV